MFVSDSANKTDRRDITEILLKVALNTINCTVQRHCWWMLIECRNYMFRSLF